MGSSQPDTRTSAISKITGGAMIYVIGVAIALVLGFFTQVIAARFLTVNDFGRYSIILSVVAFSSTISTLGMMSGIPRMLGFHRGKNDLCALNNTILFAVLFTAVVGIILSIVIFLSSDIISSLIFDDYGLSYYLKIASITITLSVVINTLVAVFRGLGDSKAKALFNDMFLRGSRFALFFVLAVIIGMTLTNTLIMYTASIVLVFIVIALYSALKLPTSVVNTKVDMNIGKQLLVFSLPLFGQAVCAMLLTHMDLLMIGSILSPEKAGIYGTARILAINVPLFLGAFGYLYVPIASKLFAQEKVKELGSLFKVITKWIFLLSAPMLIIGFGLSEDTISALFGSKYDAAGVALQILLASYFIHLALGLNQNTLLVFGKTKILLVLSVSALCVNLVLNIILIPIFGIFGAAVATAISYTLINIIASVYLYKVYSIHPFRLDLVMVLTLTLFATVALMILEEYLLSDLHSIIVLIIGLVFLLIVFYPMNFLLRGINKEDKVFVLNMVERIKKKVS